MEIEYELGDLSYARSKKLRNCFYSAKQKENEFFGCIFKVTYFIEKCQQNEKRYLRWAQKRDRRERQAQRCLKLVRL